jgi:hypothetical protein
MSQTIPSFLPVRGALFAILLGLSSVINAHANPILGAQIYANGGEVNVTFLGSDAGFDNLLFIALDPTGLIFEGHVTAVNTTKSLGNFAAGTELMFQLNNQKGNLWYTGPGSRNSDGVAHAVVDANYLPGALYVGYEDLPGGGDKDYNDLKFSVSNAHVPDAAATLPLLGFGLLGLAAFARRQRK